MELDAAARAQSLRLLKSKLHATGRKCSKSNVAPLQDLRLNQQGRVTIAKQSPSHELCLGATRRENGIHALQMKQPFKELKLTDTEISAAKTSIDNQEEISMAELKKDLIELEGEPMSSVVHNKNKLEATWKPSSTNLKKKVIQWLCSECKRECIPIREESRCLCGHRYKEHPSKVDDHRVKSTARFRAFACTSAKCSCRAFFYVVAEGAWILRCRCKHKHTDHDPTSKPFICKNVKCGCQGFDSPWVCNCNHPWSSHYQHQVEKRFSPLQLLQEQCTIQELNTVHRTDLLAFPPRF